VGVANILDKIKQGHSAQQVIGFLSETLEAENGKIDSEAFKHITAGTMTPEIGVQLWHRRFSIYRLVAKLNEMIRVGQRAQHAHPEARKPQ